MTVEFDLDAFERRMQRRNAPSFDDVELLIEVLRGEHQARATAEQELAHLRKAYDTLFETHQREMDRLHAEVARLQAELHSERGAYKGRYAFLHRHFAMMFVRRRDEALHDWAASEAGHRIERDGGCTYEDYVTKLETALRDLLAGAEQGSQSHADVAAKCRAALGEAPGQI